MAYLQPNWLRELQNLNIKKKKLLLIGTPVHGNLGDHVIAEEEKAFFNKFFNEFVLFEIQMPFYHVLKSKIPKKVNRKDIIVISGGGWMGDLWIDNEEVIRDIVCRFPENQVIIMPQTAFYSDSDKGKQEKEKTIRILKKHNNLTLFVRDKQSYSIFYRSGLSVYLEPDMALYGSEKTFYCEKPVKRDTIVCLRNDREKNINENDLIDKLKESGLQVTTLSTVLNKRIRIKERKEEINELWSRMAKANVVITDRLHAMIFAVLNGTPAVVLDNKTGKVFGVSMWLDETMVFKCNSIADVLNTVTSETFQHKVYDPNRLALNYEEIAGLIKKGIQ